MHIYHYTIVFVDKQQNKRMKNEYDNKNSRKTIYISFKQKSDTIAE